jgi:transcriptional regulator with XRE-family HTH domain
MADYLSVSEQLQLLFTIVLDDEGKPFTLTAVSQATEVSLPTLSQLRNGKISNPQLNTLRDICNFFQVPLRYFDTKTVEECQEIIAQRGNESSTSDQSPTLLTRMAATLSSDGQRDLLTLIQWARAAEQRMENGEELPPIRRLHDD